MPNLTNSKKFTLYPKTKDLYQKVFTEIGSDRARLLILQILTNKGKIYFKSYDILPLPFEKSLIIFKYFFIKTVATKNL